MAARRIPSFPDRLAAAVEERRSQVVLGLDPDPAVLWPGAVEAGFASAAAAQPADPGELAARTAAAVERHCLLAIDASAASCVATKLQAACFERLGAPGWQALAQVAEAARAAGLLVIVDGKRGDVPVTSRAYAQALVGETPGPYGPVPGLGADAFTVNPLLGRDSLEPFLAAADAASAGCFCLVRTSNPGAADLQDSDAGGEPLFERIAGMVDELGAPLRGECGLSALGAVTGATRPDLLERLRARMPTTIFLLPGVGAQGGSASMLSAAFEPHPAAGLITASRSIVNAYRERGGDPATAARTAAEELRTAGWQVT